MEIWTVPGNYVRDYLALYYKTDADVTEDSREPGRAAYPLPDTEWIYPLLRAATWRLRLPEPEMRFENAWLAQGPKVRRLFAGGERWYGAGGEGGGTIVAASN